jgi:outer membrane protein
LIRGFLIVLLAVSTAGSVAPALALEAGDWLVRLRGIAVVPTDDGGPINPDLTNTSLDPQPAYVPEVDITYMLTKNVGLELIAATSPHDFDGLGATLGGIEDQASAWLLPPTLLLQYHFLPDKKLRPYVGVGVTRITADNSLGYALQVGMDWDAGGGMFFNIDLKYIDIEVDMTLDSNGTIRTIAQEINPLIFGIGVGWKF